MACFLRKPLCPNCPGCLCKFEQGVQHRLQKQAMCLIKEVCLIVCVCCAVLYCAGDVDNDIQIFRSSNTGAATLIDAQGNRVSVVGKPTQYGKMTVWEVSNVLLSGESPWVKSWCHHLFVYTGSVSQLIAALLSCAVAEHKVLHKRCW